MNQLKSNTKKTTIPAITVIGFRRPDHIHTTLHALANNHDVQEAPLHIFLDGPREHVVGEKEQVRQTYEVCKAFSWSGKKIIHVSEKNRGLQAGVRYAIDTTFSDYKSAVIIEDDIATSPYFYRFVKQGLRMFEENEKVAAICGHCYPFDRTKYNPSEAYFLRHFACWGWATWRRAWEGVCWDTQNLVDNLKASRQEKILDFGNSRWVSRMLEDQHDGYINTWDVQVGVSFFLNKQLCLYPWETLTNNIGWRNDGLSTYVSENININAPLAYTPISIPRNLLVVEYPQIRKLYKNFVCPPNQWIKEWIKFLPRKVVFSVPVLKKLHERRRRNKLNKLKG